MSVLWSFLLYIILLGDINANSFLGYALFRNETDRLALLAIKDEITVDPHGVFNSWNNSLHHCQWEGISCSIKHPGRVTILNLSSQGLVGSISPHIGNLSFLRSIVLQNNSFHGEIPQEVVKLFRLRILYLNNNTFGGEVPKNLTNCKDLREIKFIDNNLTGEFPIELTSLPNLAVLDLSLNNFQGKIPPAIGNVSSLIFLGLLEARLEGSIPEEIGQLTRLQSLLIGGNNLTGAIPSTLYNLSSLISISLAFNKLEGGLPGDIGLRFPNIKRLTIGGNRFTGVIPFSLSNASQLKIISFPLNSFTGPVPGELGRLANLSWIGLNDNLLGTGSGDDLSFIPYLTNCSRLEKLFLGRNLLKGPLPNSIANLSSQIRYLSIGKNQIYGTVPSEIGNLVNLNVLDMQHNMFHGNIPPTIGNLQNLFQLYFHGNNFTGQIPSTLGNITFLYDLAFGENHLSGNIPPSLGNCHDLLNLYLALNELDGYIPESMFRLSSIVFINLSFNSLTGTLPPDVGNLKQLESLDVSQNKLSGSIPSSLGSCLSLMSLRMNSNSFQGTIPQTLSALRGLNELDLSCNNLSGMIPEYIGSLPFLQILNISFNDLEGEVPETGIFKNASIISLIGNKKLCGGIPELKFPACNFLHSNQRGISQALKVIVTLIIVAICSAVLVGLLIIRYRKNNSVVNLSSAPLNHQFIQISYQELLQATEGFSEANLIGSGSYGSVYKGFLHNTQSFVAVKVFDFRCRGASKSFTSECKALRYIRHRNLLKILSVCSSLDYQGNDFRAIVYEFMPGRSLESWLYPQKDVDKQGKFRSLNLEQRLNIAIQVASALEYLHCHCQPSIVHCDLKPSNVLLDKDMVAHVGDFGLAKVLSKVSADSKDDKSTSAIIKGSIGYVAPEYGMSKGANIQGDVYSFGILLLEMFTAKRPTDDMFQEDLNLHNFTRIALPNRVKDIVDQNLISDEEIGGRIQECLVSVLKVGISCSVESPRDRMKIIDVVRELHLIKEAYGREGIFYTMKD
ncbi:hypothetical protein P3X46_025718 [Hevea brasiliensis]|uniref:Protein kinase domain-containing protein n=1 Tax=Hevea brasiliensis TaxID=3981 RepID=A0ABQ9L6J9_HEVBR|nr:putative receptor-like protein kinase At3g47110 [Hevea brasiliensis]KAJ9160305.1 hypothetical protein P3X46_025718 [Hevea brasiliensis]